MYNIPKIKLGIVAVSRDCFPIGLSVSRREAIVKACEGGIYEDGTPDQIFDHPQRFLTQAFIHNIRSLRFDVKSRDYDLYKMNGQIEWFCSKYALGKTSGKANIIKNLDELGISLTPEQIRLVTDRVVELGDKKESLTREDLPFIIADVLKGGYSATTDNVHIVNYSLQLARGMHPVASVCIEIHGTRYQDFSSGDGQYDAFMKALRKIYASLGRTLPRLTDYRVTIPSGGKTDALVDALICWDNDGHHFRTRGVDSDQTEAAIKATLKMLNIVENLDLKIENK